MNQNEVCSVVEEGGAFTIRDMNSRWCESIIDASIDELNSVLSIAKKSEGITLFDISVPHPSVSQDMSESINI